MSYQNLIELTKYLEEFENKINNNSFTMEQFSYWLSEKVAKKPRSMDDTNLSVSEAVNQQSPDVQISILIGRMGKYARVYTKKIYVANDLAGMDDFSFMATLMFCESMTKAELTHHNLMDSATSGADIIKRLIRQNFIEEFDDRDDKRARRVRITKAGKQTMFKIFEEMNTVSAVITGNLGNDEKLLLLHYLKQLDELHKKIYDNDRKKEIAAIYQKYIE